MADSEEVSVSNDSEPLLSVRHLRKSYGDHEVLKDVSFDVKRGQVLVLLGPSGSGKSTLIRCLNGLETIQGGEIWFKGQKIANNSEKTWRKLRAEIGMVFQSYDLLPNLTVPRTSNWAPPRCRSARRPRSPSRWISCWPTCSSPNTRTRTRANCQEARNSASPLCVRLR